MKGGGAMLDVEDVAIAESALLVIDVQDSFKVGPRWERRNSPAFESNVAALIDAYRGAGLPVFYFLHTDGDEGFATDSPHFKLMSFLRPRRDEPVLVKDTRNVFTSTGLSHLLVERGVRRVAITGIVMEQCCETSARVAADLGYAVDFVTEATLTFPIPDRDDPSRVLGVEDIRARTEFVLKGRFARIASVAMLRSELQELRPREVRSSAAS
jgi:nicotinamidase-related amidase